MITRDPLEIPCLTEGYWATFEQVPAVDLAKYLHSVKAHKSEQPLARISPQPPNVQLALEVENNRSCLQYAREHYGFI